MDWVGWDQLSYADQLFAIWGAIAGLGVYMLLRAMFGWLFAPLAGRDRPKRKAKRKSKRKRGRR